MTTTIRYAKISKVELEEITIQLDPIVWSVHLYIEGEGKQIVIEIPDNDYNIRQVFDLAVQKFQEGQE